MGVVLLVVSLLPHQVIDQSPYPQISDLFDAANHFMGFLLFNYLLASALVGNTEGRSIRVIRYYLLIALFWGAACECSQLLGDTRSFQLMDLAANLLPLPLFVCMLRKTLKR